MAEFPASLDYLLSLFFIDVGGSAINLSVVEGSYFNLASQYHQ
jgi:hypothetical protein